MEKIKKILISQPEPKTERSPYSDLAEKHNLKLDFHKFIRIEGVSSKEYRQSKVKILEHTGVIFLSKIAVDHFFRVCEESRIIVPDSMKYFCTSENIALYLQKYIVYRKRKILYGKHTFNDLIDIINVKHTSGKLLLTMSDTPIEHITQTLEKAKIKFSPLVLYHTVSCNLSKEINLSDDIYDMLVFFTPAGIKSLFDNFTDFKQNNTAVAVFGAATKDAAIDAGLRLDIIAPTPETPSMSMAMDTYIEEFNKNRRKKKK
ncbi:MAG: uroporphyrinogen-III synthase [Bacteroidota bacterium]|nr:uroporphyrinogen-III synthase [Bacteroidota bacterium]